MSARCGSKSAAGCGSTVNMFCSGSGRSDPSGTSGSLNTYPSKDPLCICSRFASIFEGGPPSQPSWMSFFSGSAEAGTPSVATSRRMGVIGVDGVR